MKIAEKRVETVCPRCYGRSSIAEETRRPSHGTEGPSVMSKDSNIFDKRIWRVRDVAKVIGCSEGHIYNLASRDEIPKVKKGKFLFFVPSEILDWILKGDKKR